MFKVTNKDTRPTSPKVTHAAPLGAATVNNIMTRKNMTELSVYKLNNLSKLWKYIADFCYN